ncbi:hypothetical protein CCHL11_08917 [Colletotrichum chlorophyti]|uniref:CCHC-type domain-containing protein n=1 Tax=Colletotrichum chlorophyti TaxID=708187 RepID=A0A1Q8RC95_9PEZI|nr:hypothetical protein CCHL11_08917 [Colletotrichum chlorophyti]
MTNLAPETPPSRGISSRLMTMKFMQRGVASSSAAESSPDEPSSKRRKFQNSPLTGDFHSFDQAAVQAALKQQEAKRLAALEASRADFADTQWVLDGPWGKSDDKGSDTPPNIVYVGYAEIDGAAGEDDESETQQVGRKRIGSVKSQDPKVEGDLAPKAESDSSDTSDSGDSDSSDEDSSSDEVSTPKPTPKAVKGLSSGGQGRIRVNLQAKKSAESMKAREFRDKRKQKEVKLNQLSSISGGAGGISGAGKPASASFTCHSCGRLGHKAVDCPKRRGDGKRKS